MLNKIKGAKIVPFFMSDRYRLNVTGSSRALAVSIKSGC